MAYILENNNLEYDNINLGIPNQLSNNTYFSRILIDDKPLIIQPTECFTVNGLKEIKNKIICELIFSDYKDILEFFNNLENSVKNSLFKNKNDWFDDNITNADIEDAINTPIYFHQKGLKLKTYINKNNINNELNFNCYDSNHSIVDNSNIKSGSSLIPILEVIGCRFDNKSFNIEVSLIQALLISPLSKYDKPLFSNTTINKKEIQENIKINFNEQQQTNSDLLKQEINNEEHEKQETNTDLLKKEINNEEHEKQEINNEEHEKQEINEQQEINSDELKQEITNNNLEENLSSQNKSQHEINKENSYESDENSYNNDNNSDDDSINLNNDNIQINNNIEEISLDINYLDNNPIKLKTHADIYHEIWKIYKQEGFKLRRDNLKTFLNSRNIISDTLISEL